MRSFCVLVLTSLLASCQADTTTPTAPPTPLPTFEELTPREELPDLLTTLNGQAVTTAQQWHQTRRPEVARILQHYAYGQAPDADPNTQPQVEALHEDALDGQATLKLIKLRFGPGQQGQANLLLMLPNNATGPVPVFLGLNFFGNHSTTDDPRVPLARGWIPERAEGVVGNQATDASRGTVSDRWPYQQVLDRGYGLATLYHGDLDPDFDDDTNGIQALYKDDPTQERAPHAWGTIAAWAWGLSRAVDYLVTDDAVDANGIITVGHSRNGKAAVLAGGLDTRIAMSVSNMSGCMGAALSRRRKGENVQIINLAFPHWFALQLRDFSNQEDLMPFDQHFLIALMAPRPVLVSSGAADAWADPEGEFLGTQAAQPVYQLLGAGPMDADTWPEPGTLIDSPLGYHIREGGHSITPTDWQAFMDFADKNL